MELPDRIHPNDLVDALGAAIEAIERDKPNVQLADYRLLVLRQHRDEVTNATRRRVQHA